MNEPKVSIVIPVIGYKSLPNYLIKSIQSLNYPRKKIELILIKLTNQEFIYSIPGFIIHEVKRRGTIGYSQAANLGFQASTADYIFLINPDIKIEKTALQRLVEFIDGYSEVGIVGPLTCEFPNSKHISSYDLPGINFDRLLGRVYPLKPKELMLIRNPFEVNWISGCAMLIRRDAWQKIDGFDEKLFIYWEDADFCMRAKEVGFKSFLIPDAKVWHEGSMYMKGTNNQKLYYLTRNGAYFIFRHSFLPGEILNHFKNILLFCVKCFRYIFQFERKGESKVYLYGIVDYYLGKWGKVEH